MPKLCYSIVMQTPLGKKYGTLTASVCGNSLCGRLDILNHSEPFEGTVDDLGNCKIAGKMITLVRTVSYTAIGKLTATAVHLQMQSERNIFEIYGVSRPDEGERDKCENSIPEL